MIGFLLLPILLAILLFFCALHGYFGLSIDPKVRISDSLTIICTTILALALQYLFARRTTSERDQKEIASQAIKDVLDSLSNLRASISDSVSDSGVTPEQARKIIYGFECCADALIILELAYEYPDPDYLKSRAGDLTGLLLDCKRLITGDEFPKKAITYAEVELVSNLRRQMAKKLSVLRRAESKAFPQMVRQWRLLRRGIKEDFDI